MPPALTDHDVRKIAGLARLDLSDAEVELFTRQLAEILAYANEIQQIDTTDVSPTSHVLGRGAAWRDDVPAPSLGRDEVLAQASGAQTGSGVFRVPKVI
jgi:aspartyl-tRNA(Asn)/glutamyl-tRNA(Gln) amidotransferase subunit C